MLFHGDYFEISERFNCTKSWPIYFAAASLTVENVRRDVYCTVAARSSIAWIIGKVGGDRCALLGSGSWWFAVSLWFIFRRYVPECYRSRRRWTRRLAYCSRTLLGRGRRSTAFESRTNGTPIEIETERQHGGWVHDVGRQRWVAMSNVLCLSTFIVK